MSARRVRDSRFGPRGFVPLCHCVTSPEGERKRLPPFRSLARFFEIEECSPVSFFMSARRVRDNRSGPRGLVPLCHCVTSPEGERKRLPPFRSLAHYQEVEEYPRPYLHHLVGSSVESCPGEHRILRKKILIVCFTYFVRIKTFSRSQLLIVAVMSVNNRFNQDKITHKNFSREHPCEVSFLCARVR